jgi:hypothetical protein
VFGKGINGYDIGVLRMVLDNFDGRYDPWNASSPLYGNIKPGVNMTFGLYQSSTDFYIDLFTGQLQEVKVDGYNNQVTFICEDGWRWLRDQEYGKYMSTNTNLEDFIDAAFGDTYPWSLDVEASTNLPNFLFVPTGSCKSFVEDIARGTLGRAWIDTEGDFNLKTIYETTDASVKTITDDYLLRDIRISSPWDNYRSKVILNGYLADPPAASTANATIAYYSDADYINYIIPAGESYSAIAPVLNNFVYPASASSTCVDVEDEDYKDFTFTVNELSMDYLHFTITNPAPSTSIETTDQITYFLVDLYDSGSQPYNYISNKWEYETTDSSLPDNEIIITSNFWTVRREPSTALPSTSQPSTSDQTLIDDMGNTLLNFLGTVRPYPEIKYRGRYDEQFDMDLEDKVTLDLDTLNINGDYRITKISHESVINMQDIQTSIKLYPLMELST